MIINKIESIKFIEWVAKNHYVLCNETKEFCYWKNEYGIKTSEILYKEFLNESK